MNSDVLQTEIIHYLTLVVRLLKSAHFNVICHAMKQ